MRRMNEWMNRQRHKMKAAFCANPKRRTCWIEETDFSFAFSSSTLIKKYNEWISQYFFFPFSSYSFLDLNIHSILTVRRSWRLEWRYELLDQFLLLSIFVWPKPKGISLYIYFFLVNSFNTIFVEAIWKFWHSGFLQITLSYRFVSCILNKLTITFVNMGINQLA